MIYYFSLIFMDFEFEIKIYDFFEYIYKNFVKIIYINL